MNAVLQSICMEVWQPMHNASTVATLEEHALIHAFFLYRIVELFNNNNR